MSEITKTAETTKKATDHTARSSQASIDASGKTAKEAISETTSSVQNGADRTKEITQSITETVAETASAAATMSTKAAEQSREVLMMGVRTAAGVGSRVADISFGRGHDVMSRAAHAMDIYRDASERSANRVQALFSSAMMMGRGWQSMQHAWLEMMDYTMEHAAHKPQDLLRCKNMTELAEVDAVRPLRS
jgi:hypothetical protein